MNDSPVLALAGLAVIGLLATRLAWPHWRRGASLAVLLASGGPLVLAGIVLGPGIELLDGPARRALAPVTALAIGWLGATLGARFEWRRVRRIPRAAGLLALASAAAALVVVGLAAAGLARFVPSLGAAWQPRLPTILLLAVVAAASGPSAVALAARAAGLARSAGRRFVRAATLETACAAVALSVPLALQRPHASAASAGLAWVAWVVRVGGAGALVGLIFLALARLRPAPAELGFALLATLLFGAGIGYAAELSPFVVCGGAAALIVNWAPGRRRVGRVLTDGAPLVCAVLLVVAGASLALPTGALVLVGALLAGLRIAAKWAAVRFGRGALHLSDVPPELGLATVAQGGAALALGLHAVLLGGPAAAAGGAVLTTVMVAVAVAQLAAAPLLPLALGHVAQPLTAARARPELSPGASAD